WLIALRIVVKSYTSGYRESGLFTAPVRLIMQVFPAKSTGIKVIFIRSGIGSNDRAIELCVVADRNVKAIFTGVNPALVFHRIIIIVQLLRIHTAAALNHCTVTNRWYADAQIH